MYVQFDSLICIMWLAGMFIRTWGIAVGHGYIEVQLHGHSVNSLAWSVNVSSGYACSRFISNLHFYSSCPQTNAVVQLGPDVRVSNWEIALLKLDLGVYFSAGLGHSGDGLSVHSIHPYPFPPSLITYGSMDTLASLILLYTIILIIWPNWCAQKHPKFDL